MDASEFKEYIFGALFLKRASDVFEEERRRVVEAEVGRGRSEEDAELRAGDPDFYEDAFFVPPEARWSYLRDEVHHQVGNGLNKALAALEGSNRALEGVLQHIDFNRRVGTTQVTDRKWRDLIDHFSKYRLRNEDFEFPDLLGAAYEYLIRDFADSAGKKGGEFYTPRPVVQLMVRLVDPKEGMAIYDPCSGSGGMLIYARNHVADNGGDPTNLALAGQENNGTTWSISKMNMLLHGIRHADLRNDDTLTNPQHVVGGELKRFDRVITNPPFSQNYDKASLDHTERFRYGYTPEGGKKADLMFLQHMLAVLKRDGIVATVMPHGVLFRGGAEGAIRQRIIEEDLLDTVIGLGPNLFYGTGIPAAILILRAKGSKPPERRCRVLFINADRDYGEGRAQNHLRASDEQKITATYRSFADVGGFARVVTIDELADNDFNCNIRRYADSAPPPSPTMCGHISMAACRWRRSKTPRTCSSEPVSTLPTCSPTAATATPTGATRSHRPMGGPLRTGSSATLLPNGLPPAPGSTGGPTPSNPCSAHCLTAGSSSGNGSNSWRTSRRTWLLLAWIDSPRRVWRQPGGRRASTSW